MYTIKQIADEINQLKPDFTEFKKYLQSQKQKDIKIDIDNTTNIFVKLFKAQLVLVMNKTHARRYYLDTDEYKKLLFINVPEAGITSGINSYNNSTYYSTPMSYCIKDKFQSEQISYYVIDIQNYLPKYLWDKVRTKTVQTFKELKPDQFSLITFKNYLAGLKKEIPSSTALNYLTQIQNFDQQIKEMYIEVLVNHIKQTSWDFQTRVEQITGKSYSKHKQKFMGLCRYHIKGLVRKLQIPTSYSVLDTLDSSYKPFITGIKRKPTTELNELSALVNTVIILKCAVKQTPNEVYSYFIEEITEHLKHQDYKEPLANYMNNLIKYKESTEEFINEFI